MKQATTIILAILLLIGCGEQNESYELYPHPRTEFTQPLKKRTINLSNKLGESFTILRNSDTITYTVSYNRKLKYNYIIKNDWDTIFVGTASKLGGMFLLNNKLKNGNYRISAITLSDTGITGLESEFKQLYTIDDEILAGNLVSMQDSLDPYLLHPEKKKGKRIYQKILAQLPSEKLLIDPTIIEVLENIFDNSGDPMATNLDNHKIIAKAFPNPVQNILTVQTTNSIINYEYILTDVSGKTYKSGTFYENGGDINCSELSSGVYFLIIKDTHESIKIIKE